MAEICRDLGFGAKESKVRSKGPTLIPVRRFDLTSTPLP